MRAGRSRFSARVEWTGFPIARRNRGTTATTKSDAHSFRQAPLEQSGAETKAWSDRRVFPWPETPRDSCLDRERCRGG